MNETTNYDMVTKALALAQDENFKLAALNREMLEALRQVRLCPGFGANLRADALCRDIIAKAEGRA